ncbi:MAG: metal-dependent transcriptional regulator [Proteobacteria bacterium]|nr:metal-dependent transcriptional regulator [Pseudomonadota bacterium]
MSPSLTSSLEDYLETIYLLQQGTGQEARVRDIAAARSVKASSVSPALKRLSEMGYLKYEQRETIRLTEEGKIAARRVYARHVLLFQFFHDILGMPEDKAREEACGLEHALSDEGMDRFVHFFESRSLCSGCHCHADAEHGDMKCGQPCELVTLASVADGERVSVVLIRARNERRQTILDMGILPNVILVRKETFTSGVVVDVDAHELRLTHEQTEDILVRRCD